VPTDHANAEELLARDVENIVSYFQRKYPAHVEAVDTDAVAAALAGDAFESLHDYTD